MKNPKTIAITVGVIVLIGVGFFFVRGPKPVIQIKAEHPLFANSVFPLANTYTSSVLTVVVVLVLGYLGGRKAKLIPHAVQNLVEAVLEAGYNICVSTAGEKNGRRFFPVFMTIFIFVWIANWLALLPFFNAIGTVEHVSATEFHKEAAVFSSTAGMLVINPNSKALSFDVPITACTDVTGDAHNTCLAGARGQAIITKLHEKEGVAETGAECASLTTPEQWTCYTEHSETAITQLDAKGKQLGIIAPYFRSTNTDINSPLSLAIMSAIFVEFWGISALGFFKYGKKFVNFTRPLGMMTVINLAVGFLEFVAEVARLISFTFRLFGNVLAGDIILLVLTFLVPFVVAVPFYGLEMFFGFIQAFIFAMLTLVFGVLAVSTHDEHGEHEPVEVTALH